MSILGEGNGHLQQPLTLNLVLFLPQLSLATLPWYWFLFLWPLYLGTGFVCLSSFQLSLYTRTLGF